MSPRKRLRSWDLGDWLIELVYWPATIFAWGVILICIPFFFHGGWFVIPVTAHYWTCVKDFRDDWHADDFGSGKVGRQIDNVIDKAPVPVYGPHSFNGFGGTPSKAGRVPVDLPRRDHQ